MSATSLITVPPRTAPGSIRPADAGQSDHPVHRGRRDRRRHHARHAGVVDAAVEKAYGGARKIHWMEIYAGEKSTRLYGADVWLPDETLEAVREYVVSIKGPLTTPVGGGIRSLNVALRQELDLYVCLRPVRYFKGVPGPLKEPDEDRHGDLPREHRGHLRRHRVGGRVRRGARKLIAFLQDEIGVREDPLPGDLRHRHQADLARGHGAARPRGAPVRDRATTAVGDAGPQGQHHEVHRGRVPRLGLRGRARGVRRRADRRRPVDDVREPEARAARSSSRT